VAVLPVQHKLAFIAIPLQLQKTDAEPVLHVPKPKVWLRIHTLATAKEPLAAVKQEVCIAWQRRQVVTMHRNV